MCHVSRVIWHVSPVRCHLSHVKENVLKKNILKKNLDKGVELVGGGFVINGSIPSILDKTPSVRRKFRTRVTLFDYV